MTMSPTTSFEESPKVAGFRLPSLTLTTATSLAGNVPTSVALKLLPSAVVTLKRDSLPTTWALVTMSPLPSKTIPEPRPLVVSITTTDGLTCWTTATYCDCSWSAAPPEASGEAGCSPAEGGADGEPEAEVAGWLGVALAPGLVLVPQAANAIGTTRSKPSSWTHGRAIEDGMATAFPFVLTVLPDRRKSSVPSSRPRRSGTLQTCIHASIVDQEISRTSGRSRPREADR